MSGILNTILYVEDDESIAEVAKMTMEELGGYEVHHYFSGRAALDALPSVNPELVLLDVMMPEMDGPETLKELRTVPEGKTVPVIFMTARAQTHEQAEYLQLGAIGVIVKPFDPMTLCSQLQSLWGKSAAG